MLNKKLLTLLALATMLGGPAATATSVENVELPVDYNSADIPCVEEGANVVRSLASANLTIIEGEANDFIACVTDQAQRSVCLKGVPWIDDEHDTAGQYANYLQNLIPHERSVPLLAQVFPQQKNDLYHREILLVADRCRTTDLEGDATAWWIESTPSGPNTRLWTLPAWIGDLPE